MPALTQLERRRAQVRDAKRAQRQRQTRNGLAACQVVVPQPLPAMLRECAKNPELLGRLQDWLALEVVEVAAWPQLALLCWGRHDAWISGSEALAIYERNARFFAVEELTPTEAAFVAALARRHGRGVFLG